MILTVRIKALGGVCQIIKQQFVSRSLKCYNTIMKFHPEHVVRKARRLRRRGFSGAEIGRRLNIPDTAILRWCVDIPSKNLYHLHIQKLIKKAKKRSIKVVKNVKINKERARLLTSILYWCEGAKYPSSNFISFSNSEIELVRTFITLFRIGFQPEERKLKAYLQLHTTHDKEKITSFWSRILKIPKSQFYKATITKPTKNMKRRNYKGTCTVRYYDVYLLHEIMGIYEEFFKKVK